MSKKIDFVAKRTSRYDGQPFVGARLVEATGLDWRTVPTIKEALGKHWGKDWLDRTRNHQEKNGMVVGERLKPEEIWIISLAPEEIMPFVQKHESVIIEKYDDYKEYDYRIEVYDDYRE